MRYLILISVLLLSACWKEGTKPEHVQEATNLCGEVGIDRILYPRYDATYESCGYKCVRQNGSEYNMTVVCKDKTKVHKVWTVK